MLFRAFHSRTPALTRRGGFIRAGVFAVVFLVAAGRASAEWTPLLDDKLSQWDTYLSFRHDTNYAGGEPVDAAGNKVPPVGYHTDPTRVFSIVQVDGQSALRISGEIYGCLFTKQEFRNYRLRLKVKWGTAKADPRKDKLRDSGILYHSQGPAGVDYWRAWMLSQEFQIMEGHMGDYWGIANSSVDIRAFLPEGSMNSIASDRQPFLPFGSKPSIAGLCLRSNDYESPAGEWTDLELVCFEGRSLHIVNGHVVMILKNSRAMHDGKAVPLVEGKIQLQSEAAEVFYRDIAIEPIDRMPAEYVRLFE